MDYYVIENCGPERMMWGPYPSLERAKHEAGKRHFVATGDACANAKKLKPAELKALIGVGSILIADGASIDGI